jgi:ribosomal protein S16
MSKPKTDISEIIEGIITYAPTKSKQDAEEQIDRDKVNYLIWQIGVAVKELQQAIKELQQDKDIL